MKPANVYDVAAAAGVSTATVSRYFRSPEKLSQATLDLVREAVDRLGYLPSGMARGLAERQTGAVGLYSFSGHEPDELIDADRAADSEGPVRPRLYPLFADEVLRGVELECTLRRLPLVVGWQLGREAGISLDEIARRVDGVVVLPSTISEAQLAQLAKTKAVVLVSQPGGGRDGIDSVVVDNEGGMAALAEHLVHVHGVRALWYAGPENGYEHEARRRGLDSALARAGVPLPGPTVVDAGSRAASREIAARLLAAEEPPRAIVCASDQTALGVMEAVRAAGHRIPEDVIVTGFDGIDAGRLTDPGLTTVRQPMERLGRAAMGLLAERLADPGLGPRNPMLPVELLLRGSCGCGDGRPASISVS
ncbi:LacI family transcriptional regulator [Microbacterium resistens]|uniref:LacI family transcriptional regulator n=1 Tax=Microbacterium resistens TaxID=156977 RepID=A0ABU1S9Z8_9MICO|nr:LacI family DNA-binding transcriptional regulator [Microbacterium resistens]MDR6865642.1 LacI family transcriptional regulator [Microbacterium resistens]